MSDINQGSGKGIMVAAMVGAAVGAGVALLLAPCSGRDTRRWLAQRSRDVTDRTTSAFEHGKEALRRAAKEIGRDVEEASNALHAPAHADAGATTTYPPSLAQRL